MPEKLIPGFPVDVGPAYEGERIRKNQMYVEFGGLKVPYKFELVLACKPEEVEDGKVEVIGPDLTELKEGGSYPIGILVKVAGKKVDRDLEGVIERRLHEFMNYIQGVMHVAQRDQVWIRISKTAVKKGLNSLKYIGQALIHLYRHEMPFIEKIEVSIITDPEKVKELLEKLARPRYEERDRRALSLRDEDVDTFYGCILCQSFAPTHVCVITPERPANCGAISYFDARAAANIDPKGPVFPIPKGKCIDGVAGEYEGVNEVVRQKSMGKVERVKLYTAFDHPHTSCGCFEAIVFYIPEVDGLGVVHRDFKGTTVNGLRFSEMAAQTGGGLQTEGFHGVSVLYMKSRKFLIADGGWKRIVWLPSELKERVKDAIPSELYDKIATEKDVSSIDELKKFLIEKGHPLAEKIKSMEEAEKEEVTAEGAVPTMEAAPSMAVPAAMTPIRIVLKGARIKIGKIIIKKSKR